MHNLKWVTLWASISVRMLPSKKATYVDSRRRTCNGERKKFIFVIFVLQRIDSMSVFDKSVVVSLWEIRDTFSCIPEEGARIRHFGSSFEWITFRCICHKAVWRIVCGKTEHISVFICHIKVWSVIYLKRSSTFHTLLQVSADVRCVSYSLWGNGVDMFYG